MSKVFAITAITAVILVAVGFACVKFQPSAPPACCSKPAASAECICEAVGGCDCLACKCRPIEAK